MSFRYLTFHAAGALKIPFSRRARSARMSRFASVMNLRGGERIIDLGGVPKFWAEAPVPLDLTIVNLPGELPEALAESRHRIRLVEGDACDVAFAKSGAFDIAFSNSVIEHVGGPENRRRLALEARRLAPRYWVQTPSIWFPVEAHSHMPFWWFYPAATRERIMRRWSRKLPAWTEMVRGTTVLSRAEMAELFPGADLWTERFLGFPKSYVAYRAAA